MLKTKYFIVKTMINRVLVAEKIIEVAICPVTGHDFSPIYTLCSRAGHFFKLYIRF